MKISEVTDEIIASFIRDDDLSKEDTVLLSIIKPAAKAYIVEHTALSEKQLDEHEDLTIAYLILVEDMFDNRVMAVNYTNSNRTVETILSMHDMNHVG